MVTNKTLLKALREKAYGSGNFLYGNDLADLYFVGVC